MRVLVTRPIEDADRTSEALAAAGHKALIAPLFAVAPLPHAMPAVADAVVATSANAIRQADLSDMPRDRPVYAVGRATAAEAGRAGFRDVRSADGDAGDLAALLAAGPHRRLVYLAGRPRRDAALKALGAPFEITVVETYETRAVEALPAAAAGALRLGEVEAILHFSPRAAVVFERLATQAGLGAEAGLLLHVFISDAAVTDAFPHRRIAERPNLAAMIAALDGPPPVRN
jgi:uroporphyrinogen-III synthase